MNCNKKQKYFTKHMADEYCDAYNNDILVDQRGGLGSYWCSRHKSWHVGHLQSAYTTPSGPLDDIMWLMEQVSQEVKETIDDSDRTG